MKEVIVAVITSVVTAGILWMSGFIGKSIGSVPVPSGAVMAFNLEQCPDKTWLEVPNAKGRYIVGLTKEGILGSAVGSPLAPQEDRASGRHNHGTTEGSGDHSHVLNRALNSSGSGIYVKWDQMGQTKKGASNDAIDHGGSHDHTIADNSAPQGTNAPYIQFLMCEKK